MKYYNINVNIIIIKLDQCHKWILCIIGTKEKELFICYTNIPNIINAFCFFTNKMNFYPKKIQLNKNVIYKVQNYYSVQQLITVYTHTIWININIDLLWKIK